MIPISTHACIYLVCYGNFATGGPESLHQLAFHLKKAGFGNVFMYYIPYSNGASFDPKDPVHLFYKKYGIPFVRNIVNKEENLLIVPETILDPVFDRRMSKIRKAVWWLSVTNYYRVLEVKEQYRKEKEQKIRYWLRRIYNPIRIGTWKELKKYPLYHISQSYFSDVHLRKNGIEPAGRLCAYINKTFSELLNEQMPKEDVILYNPAKNGEFLKKIIKKTPHLNWKPLTGLVREEVVKWMNRSKLYVDFGYHPGKERMPREACITHCCLIIGKDGSARYKEDMPIPDSYLFEKEETQIPLVIKRIEECLHNYDKHIQYFKPYREIIYQEEKAFAEGIPKVFVRTGAETD